MQYPSNENSHGDRNGGHKYAAVETGAMSGPIVEKHGFQHLTTVHDFEWKGN